MTSPGRTRNPPQTNRGAILGINAFHGDAAACLVVDGELEVAIEEERLTRVKHQAGFPSAAVSACLEHARIAPEQLLCVAVNADPSARLAARRQYAARSLFSPRLLYARWRHRRARQTVLTALAELDPAFANVPVHAVEHHRAHLASAFYASGWDTAAVVSMDGFGDFASTSWAHGGVDGITPLGEVRFPHSAGILYQALTQYLGFPHYGDEYKVMGLAAHGEPGAIDLSRLVELRDAGQFRLNLAFFRHHRENVALEWSGGAPTVGRLYSDALTTWLGPARAPDEPIDSHHRALAAAAQTLYEKVFFHVLNEACARVSGQRRLALAGGCAQNSLANGAVRERTGFTSVYVPPAAGDAGGAAGAALQAWAQLRPDVPVKRLAHAYLGPDAGTGSDAIADALHTSADALALSGAGVTELSEAELLRRTSAAIANGGVVGWFQDRAEWGPRALGNRSILADPRRSDMRELLNRKIKLREPFRPFAPSVLAEHAETWFECAHPVPFMSEVAPIRVERRDQVPAVVHADGTGRLQTVSAQTNPRFHGLITAFHELTGVPMLVNTSFNENEPIVLTPDEAIACFLRTGMDMLVLGTTVVERLGDSSTVSDRAWPDR